MGIKVCDVDIFCPCMIPTADEGGVDNYMQRVWAEDECIRIKKPRKHICPKD